MKLRMNTLLAAFTAAFVAGHSCFAAELRFPAAPQAVRPGSALAADGTHFLAGDPGTARTTPNNGTPGAVHVHAAGSGAHLRTLVSPESANGDQFGSSVALGNGLALVGAPGTKPTMLVGRVNGAVGAAYVIDVNSGALVHRLAPTLKPGFGISGQSFGASVGICGNLAVVGAPAEQGGRGSVYVFDMQQRGQLVRRIVLPNAAAGDRFGTSCATAGTLAVVGAPGKITASGATRRGAAYVVDVTTGAVVQVLDRRSLNDVGRPALVPGVTASSFGTAVAMAEALAVVEETQEINGQPVQALVHVNRIKNGLQVIKLAADGPRAIPAISGSLLAVGSTQAGTAGSVAFYNALNGERLSTLVPSDAQVGDGFGRSVTINGSTLLAGTSAAGSRAAVYQFTELAGPLPARVVTHTGAQAPSIAGATIDLMSLFHINKDGETQVRSSLAGNGVNNSNNRAIFNELRPKPLRMPAARGAWT